MAINSYFNNFNHVGQQLMLDNLIMDSIKIFGVPAYYIPRTLENLDQLFGEDPAAVFNQANQLEVYIKTYDGNAGGNAKFLGKFGIEVRENMTVCFSIRRFNEIANQKLIMENGYNYLLESATRTYGTQFPNALDCIRLEDGNSNNFSINFTYPRTGDIIYIPMIQKGYQIQFVKDDDVQFYQLGKLYMYEADCELFEYSHETFETNIPDVDNNFNQYLNNKLLDEFVNEDGTKLLDEDGSSLINEDYSTEINDSQSNTSVFKTAAESIVDWDSASPFVTGKRW